MPTLPTVQSTSSLLLPSFWTALEYAREYQSFSSDLQGRRDLASERCATLLMQGVDADLQSTAEMETATVYPFVLYQVVAPADLLQIFHNLMLTSCLTEQSPIIMSVCRAWLQLQGRECQRNNIAMVGI